jgi:hypothetical protein
LAFPQIEAGEQLSRAISDVIPREPDGNRGFVEMDE